MTTPTVAVLVATTGRPTVLTETLRVVAAQTRLPDRLVVCPAKPEDIDPDALAGLPCPVEIVRGASGLAAQRNVLLRAAHDADLVLFIDDDFLLARDYLQHMTALFADHRDCTVATGRVLADGATNRGYSVAEGRAILAQPRVASQLVTPVFNAYGCNMALRWSRLKDTGCWFDEDLPLYAWAEDVDFSRQAARFGRVLKADTLVGVHLAWKSGRVSGVRFGYSQIANQIYLARKGTITTYGGVRKAAENILANLVGSLRDDSFIDRRGRLVGNLYALRDALAGRSSPQRILDL